MRLKFTIDSTVYSEKPLPVHQHSGVAAFRLNTKIDCTPVWNIANVDLCVQQAVLELHQSLTGLYYQGH